MASMPIAERSESSLVRHSTTAEQRAFCAVRSALSASKMSRIELRPDCMKRSFDSTRFCATLNASTLFS